MKFLLIAKYDHYSQRIQVYETGYYSLRVHTKDYIEPSLDYYHFSVYTKKNLRLQCHFIKIVNIIIIK